MANCSEWKVSRNYFQGEYFYIAYRLIDKDEVDCPDNREYFGHYSQDIHEVQKIVDELNAEEKFKSESLKKSEELNNTQSLQHDREEESVLPLKAVLNEFRTSTLRLLQLLELLIEDE